MSDQVKDFESFFSSALNIKKARAIVSALSAVGEDDTDRVSRNRMFKRAIAIFGGSPKSSPSQVWYDILEVLMRADFVKDDDVYGLRLIARGREYAVAQNIMLDPSLPVQAGPKKRGRKAKVVISHNPENTSGVTAPEFLRTLGQGYIALADAFEESRREMSEKIDALEKQVAALRASSEPSLRGEVDRVYQEVVYAIGRVSGKK